MAQFARPDSDVAAGGWVPIGGPVTLFDTLNEVAASDVDFADSSTNPVNDQFEVGLSNIGDPVSSVGHVLRYRYQKDLGSRQIDLTVDLVQGTTIIATFVHVAIANGFVTAAQTLTGPQADAITDYDDLRIRFNANFVGGGGATEANVSFAEFEVPFVPLAGTIDGQSALVSVLGVNFPISGLIAAQSAVPAAPLAKMVGLSGGLAAVSTLQGTLEGTIELRGTVDGQSITAGNIIKQVSLIGNANALSALVGSLNIPRILIGAIAGQSAVVGALPVGKSLITSVPGASTVVGRILLDQEMGGLIAAVSTLSGVMTVDFAMSGVAAGQSVVAGRLENAFGIQGVINSFSTLDAFMRRNRRIAGTIAAQSTMGPNLLSAIAGMKGNIIAVTTTDGDIGIMFSVEGLIAAQAVVDARLRINGEQITTGVGGRVIPLVTIGGKMAVNNE